MKVWGIHIDEEYASKLTINQFEREFGRLFNNKASMIVEAYKIINSSKKEEVIKKSFEPLIDLKDGEDSNISEAAKKPESEEGKTRRKKNI